MAGPHVGHESIIAIPHFISSNIKIRARFTGGREKQKAYYQQAKHIMQESTHWLGKSVRDSQAENGLKFLI